MVQLRVGRTGLRDLPLVDDAEGTFYFKGEGDSSVWLSPHDEIPTDPCDAAPEEIDVATAIDRFEGVVDWPVERVERTWAGLRSSRRSAASLRLRFACPGFLLVRGTGRFRNPDIAGGGEISRGVVAEGRSGSNGRGARSGCILAPALHIKWGGAGHASLAAFQQGNKRVGDGGYLNPRLG
jgi:D-arginine dehydrogenase